MDFVFWAAAVPSGTQCNHALVKKGLDIDVKQLPMSHKVYTYLSHDVEFYTWSEVTKQSSKKIPRKPVVLSLSSPDKPAEKMELMIFHTKSKISDWRSKKQWENRDVEAIVDALRSRQRLSGELAAVRRYLTHAILSKRTEGCIVIGDLNEGPNWDIFEEKFLLTNIVDELRGGFHREEALMHHALEREWLGPDRALAYSAEFRDPTQDGKKVKTLLDHIMVSTSIRHGKAPFKIRTKDGLIEHEIFEKHVKNYSEMIDRGIVKLEIDPKFAQSFAVQSMIERVSLCGNARWDIIINNDPTTPFFTSDFPVAIEPSRSDPRVINRIIPLAPDLAIRILPDMGLRKEMDLGFSNLRVNYPKLSRPEILALNTLIVRCAETTVFYRDDKPWVVPLVAKNGGYRIEPKTMKIPVGSGEMVWTTMRVEQTAT